MDLSYWESLRAFWRVYWPSQLALAVLSYIVAVLGGVAGFPLLLGGIAFNCLALFVFIPRICSRSYRGFSLVLVGAANDEASGKMNARQRASTAVFLWWRQIVAGLAAGLLLMPLNIVLGIMGLQVGAQLAVPAAVLGVGPILMKMLIGNQFKGFRIEARRERKSANPAATAEVQAPVQ